jgi:hypothetical protein
MAFSKGFIWKKAKIGVVIAAETEAQLNSELDAAATTLTQWRWEQGKRASAVMVTIMANEEHVEEYAGRTRTHAALSESVKGLATQVCFPDQGGESIVMEFQIG